jgi:GTP-binding protein HflX
VLVADTVGFVRRLPHHLVEAFQSTLAEVAEADLLLHVVDASEPDLVGQLAAVRDVLVEIDANEIPELLVFNKVDLVGPAKLDRLKNLYPEACFVSALGSIGMETLIEEIGTHIERQMVNLTLTVPYDRGDIVAAAYRVGDVLGENHEGDGTHLEVRIPVRDRSRFNRFEDRSTGDE